MKLSAIRLKNFGPYYGKQAMDLTVSEPAPVIVVYGENLHGKTSLLRAIRWCLYAQALDQRSQPIPFKELVNYDLQTERQWLMSVELDFTHEGKSYELMRQIQADREPDADIDFQMIKELRVDGRIVGVGQIDDSIAGILHRDISTFFLFDGEMLGRYEDLLVDDSGGAVIVRRSIEQILGLPALRSVQEDFAELTRVSTRQQTKALDALHKDVTLLKEVESLSSQKESLRADLEQLNALLQEEQSDKEGLRTGLDRYREVEAQARELRTLTEETTDLEGQRREAQLECRRILSDQWWLPLVPTAAKRLTAAEQELSELTNALTRQADAQLIALAIREQTCPTCGAAVGKERHSHLNARLKELSEDGIGPIDPGRLGDLNSEIRQLREITAGQIDAMATAEREYRKVGIEIRRKNRRVAELEEMLRGHEIEEISGLQHKYDDAVRRIGDVQRQIADQQGNLDDVDQRLRKKRSQVRNAPGVPPRLAAEAAGYEALGDLFGAAINGFRQRLREQVEAEATDIFKKLITATDLNKLRINDQYGLSIVTDDGRVLTIRSAGTSQIVALSLIAALNHCALREGPVVMDTPFGRLDRAHRKNVLGYMAHFGPQVILLVQSGEFERARDLAALGTAVAREYELRRVDGRSTKSEVVLLD